MKHSPPRRPLLRGLRAVEVSLRSSSTTAAATAILFSLIAVAVPVHAGGVCSIMPWGCPSEYDDHVACNERWRASHAYRVQGCKSYKINADGWIRYGNGPKKVRCYYDVYCKGPQQWQRAHAKGLIDNGDLDDMARCKDNPNTIKPYCEPVTEEQLMA